MKYLIIIILFFSCKTDIKSSKNKNQKTTISKVISTPKTKSDSNKKKVGNNTYKEALKRTLKYANELEFDLDYIRNKGLADKKYLAEYLGLFVKLKKAMKTKEEKDLIMKKLTPFYKKTLEPSFHNMSTVNDKLFKKNSMSYLRILWLLDQLGFDNTYYKKELAKVQTRMDDHMKVRGEWQRAVFGQYYDYFKIKKPIKLKYAHKLNGPITYQKPIDYFDRLKAYNITHFVFAAYDYGQKIKQTRFSKRDIDYLSEILPQLITKFEAKNNDDLVGELLTCLVLINKTNTKAFKNSYNRLLRRQNMDGSFGDYERGRKKHGNAIEFKYYLHTTLVNIEMFIEHNYRKQKLKFS